MTIDRAIIIALALVCAALSVALNTEKHGRIADVLILMAYLIIGSAIVIWWVT